VFKGGLLARIHSFALDRGCSCLRKLHRSIFHFVVLPPWQSGGVDGAPARFCFYLELQAEESLCEKGWFNKFGSKKSGSKSLILKYSKKSNSKP
jgi:hypothetical protein